MSVQEDNETDLARLSTWYEQPFGCRLKRQIADKLTQILGENHLNELMHLGVGGFEEVLSSKQHGQVRFFTDIACEHLLTEHENSLPITAGSIECVVLLHGLDLAENPHGLLREVDRILAMDGHLIIVGFNPVSLWGAYRPLRNLVRRSQQMPWRLPFYRLSRLRDWLKLLSFETKELNTISYQPLVYRDAWLQKLAFVDSIGNFTLQHFGNVYLMVSQKRTVPLTQIRLAPVPLQPRVRNGLLKPSTIEACLRVAAN